jgi:predicted aspartyl protease
MNFPFEPDEGLVIVKAELTGPSATAVVRLALDTGATSTLINAAILTSLGYDPAKSPDRIEVTTGSGLEYVPQVVLSGIKVLGKRRSGFPVLCHTLPPSTGVDGVLGVDYFRQQVLRIDFREGKIALNDG